MTIISLHCFACCSWFIKHSKLNLVCTYWYLLTFLKVKTLLSFSFPQAFFTLFPWFWQSFMRKAGAFAQLLWCCCRKGWITSKLCVPRQGKVRVRGTFRDVLGLCGRVLVVVGLQEKPLQGEARGCPVPVTTTSSHLCSRFSAPELSPPGDLVVPLGNQQCCWGNTFKKG